MHTVTPFLEQLPRSQFQKILMKRNFLIFLTYLPKNMASSSAHRRLDSWWPRPAHLSQFLPGQSILLPQYKYLSWRVWCLLCLGFIRFLMVILENENPFVESWEEYTQRNTMADMQMKRIRIGDLAAVFAFGLCVLWTVAIEVAETRTWKRWLNRYDAMPLTKKEEKGRYRFGAFCNLDLARSSPGALRYLPCRHMIWRCSATWQWCKIRLLFCFSHFFSLTRT